MKRDVQVGVTLGVIIMAIIGVFLSTRTTVNEPSIPIPEMEEQPQDKAFDISELSPEPQNASKGSFQGVTAQVQHPEEKEASVSDVAKTDEQPAQKDDRIIEVEWKKSKEPEPLPITRHDENLSSESNPDDWKDISSDDNKNTAAQVTKYKVKSNDSLRKIAKKYYGDESKWLVIFTAAIPDAPGHGEAPPPRLHRELRSRDDVPHGVRTPEIGVLAEAAAVRQAELADGEIPRLARQFEPRVSPPACADRQ